VAPASRSGSYPAAAAPGAAAPAAAAPVSRSGAYPAAKAAAPVSRSGAYPAAVAAPASSRPSARVAVPQSAPTAPMLARPAPEPAASRIARGTHGVPVIADTDPTRDLDVVLEIEPDGATFADGSDGHGVLRADPGDVTAADVQAAPADPSDDEPTNVDSTARHIARSLRANANRAPDPAPLPRATSRLRRTPSLP
jgi:hypothetical protein